MDTSPIRVLLVDDDHDDYVILRDLFLEIEAGKFRLEWVETYDTALEQMLRNEHDVYLIDYLLGERNGLELLKEAVKKRCKGPIILLTGKGAREVDMAVMKAGASDYLDKGEVGSSLLERSIRYAIERKRAEEALRESEEKYRTQFEETLDAILVSEAETGILVDCNHAASVLVGRAKSEIVGKHQRILHPPEEVEGEFSRTYKQHLEDKQGQSLEAQVITKDGEIRDVSIKANIFETKGKKFMQGIFRDVTEWKRAEGALIQAKEDWENTFDAITDMVMLLDNRHQVIRVNRAAAEALNTTKENLVGNKCYEAIHRQSHPIRECPLALTIKTLEPQTAEITEPKLGGTFICSTSPILDQDGNLTGYTHTLKDITKSKQLEAQFQQAQRLEAIGTLAGGVAHDFNNLLTGIQGNVSLMFLDMDTTHPHYERLTSIEKQVKSGARLTSHLLGYARKGKYEVRPVDLNYFVRGTSDTFGRTRKDISIHRELSEELFAVEADSGQIEQVLWNLLANAADAMPGGGDLILKTMNISHKDIKGKFYDPKPGNYVVLTVTDTGTGMDKETIERIFDPFFTTKEMGRGTGLGLASAYGIIKGHGGYIDADSKKGHGTTFSIYLPASEREFPKPPGTAEPFVRGTETILLVDDEEVILEVGQELFEVMGYRVLLARDGKEAVEVYRKNQDEIDIVLLDMVMPTMGGGEAYDRMKEINPDIKVLLSSGYSIDGEATEILERGCNGFIQKPFRMNQLAGKIREILDKK
jgi:PAS domain S-box-containing protein